MEFKINLENTVAAALEAALSPDIIRTKVAEAVSKVVDKAVSDAFSPYGEFATVVKKAVAELVPHGLDINDASSFTLAVQQAITLRLQQLNDERMKQYIEPMLNALLEPAPTELKLSDLIHAMCVKFAEDRVVNGSSRPYIRVDRTEGIVAGYHHIFIDPDAGKMSERQASKYAARYQIDVTDKGEVYGLKINGSDVGKTLFAGPYFNVERQLVNIYTLKTRLVVDQTEFSPSYEDFEGIED